MIIIRKLHSEFPGRVVEWGLGYIIITWCTVLFLYPNLMQQSNQVYQSWLMIMDQSRWALLGFSIGMMRVAALYVNGAHRRSPYVRLLASFLSMGFWFCVTVGMMRAPPSTALAVYPWLMVADGYAVYISAGDSFRSWSQRKGVAQ